MALALIQLTAVALVGVGMIRARIPPAPTVGLFTLAPVATIAHAATLTAAGVDAALYAPLGVVAFAVGLAWVGWFMWREPARDEHAARERGRWPLDPSDVAGSCSVRSGTPAGGGPGPDAEPAQAE